MQLGPRWQGGCAPAGFWVRGCLQFGLWPLARLGKDGSYRGASMAAGTCASKGSAGSRRKRSNSVGFIQRLEAIALGPADVLHRPMWRVALADKVRFPFSVVEPCWRRRLAGNVAPEIVDLRSKPPLARQPRRCTEPPGSGQVVSGSAARPGAPVRLDWVMQQVAAVISAIRWGQGRGVGWPIAQKPEVLLRELISAGQEHAAGFVQPVLEDPGIRIPAVSGE